MVKTKTQTKNPKDCQSKGCLQWYWTTRIHILLIQMKNYADTSQNNVTVSCKAVRMLTIWPSDSMPGYLSWDVKIYVHIQTCRGMFTGASFMNDPNWKQPIYPPNLWKVKLWYIHMIEYCSPTKRDDYLVQAVT